MIKWQTKFNVMKSTSSWHPNTFTFIVDGSQATCVSETNVSNTIPMSYPLWSKLNSINHFFVLPRLRVRNVSRDFNRCVFSSLLSSRHDRLAAKLHFHEHKFFGRKTVCNVRHGKICSACWIIYWNGFWWPISIFAIKWMASISGDEELDLSWQLMLFMESRTPSRFTWQSHKEKLKNVIEKYEYWISCVDKKPTSSFYNWTTWINFLSRFSNGHQYNHHKNFKHIFTVQRKWIPSNRISNKKSLLLKWLNKKAFLWK